MRCLFWFIWLLLASKAMVNCMINDVIGATEGVRKHLCIFLVRRGYSSEGAEA